MVTVIDFLVHLGNSIVDLVNIFGQVAFRDPIGFLSFLVGMLVMGFTMLFSGWLALGAVARQLGFIDSVPGHTPHDTPPRY
jgi:ABC-type Na+ efflux pump permease subunit